MSESAVIGSAYQGAASGFHESGARVAAIHVVRRIEVMQRAKRDRLRRGAQWGGAKQRREYEERTVFDSQRVHLLPPMAVRGMWVLQRVFANGGR